jgi:hypothetical protein
VIYQFKVGARVPKGADAEQLGKRLERIAKRKGGLTVQGLTDEAEANPDDPVLSPWFEWDTELAVRKYHEMQASSLILSVAVVELSPEQSTPVRAFVITSDNGETHYGHILNVVSKPDQRKMLIERVAQEKKHYDDKFNELVELIKLL